MLKENLHGIRFFFPVPNIGISGQEKLLASKVLIIGAGGLGSPAALYLAAAGVGTIGIVDSDDVELSNLQRQILYGTSDIGQSKVDVAAETLRNLNPDIRVIPYHILADSKNLPDLLKDFDFVLECTDTFASKLLINDACVKADKPFCHGSVIRFFGQVMTWEPGRGPCYRCVFHDLPDEGAVLSARDAGVVGAAAGVIGCLQATEAIKYLLGIGDLLTGRLLVCDLLDMEFQIIPLFLDPECPSCGHKEFADGQNS